MLLNTVDVPIELLFVIVEYLRPSDQTSFARASKAFHRIATRVLYATPSINSYIKLIQFFNDLGSPLRPTLGSYVTSLEIPGGALNLSYAELLRKSMASAIPRMPNLQKFSGMSPRPNFPLYPEIFAAFLSISGLTSISISVPSKHVITSEEVSKFSRTKLTCNKIRTLVIIMAEPPIHSLYETLLRGLINMNADHLEVLKLLYSYDQDDRFLERLLDNRPLPMLHTLLTPSSHFICNSHQQTSILFPNLRHLLFNRGRVLPKFDPSAFPHITSISCSSTPMALSVLKSGSRPLESVCVGSVPHLPFTNPEGWIAQDAYVTWGFWNDIREISSLISLMPIPVKSFAFAVQVSSIGVLSQLASTGVFAFLQVLFVKCLYIDSTYWKDHPENLGRQLLAHTPSLQTFVYHKHGSYWWKHDRYPSALPSRVPPDNSKLMKITNALPAWSEACPTLRKVVLLDWHEWINVDGKWEHLSGG